MQLPLSALTTLRHVPGYAHFSVAALLLGTAASFAMPYMPLFAKNEAGMSPLSLGLFLTLTSLSGILISTQLARWSDRTRNRRFTALLTITAAALGYLLLTTTRDYVALVLIASFFLGTGAGAFPQLFALARSQFETAGADASERGMIALRSLFSVAWMLGPGVAAAVLAGAGFTGLFLVAAACYLLVGVPLLLARPKSAAPATTAPRAELSPSGLKRPLMLVALSFALFGMSNNMAFIALPLHVTDALNQPASTVGFLVGLCAFLEIPFILSFAMYTRKITDEKLIIFSFALFAVYSVMMAYSPAVWLLAVAQLLRAAVIAVTTTLGMSYFQTLMPNRTAAALTLYSNTFSVGTVLSGIVSGVFAQLFSYQAVFLLSAVLTGAAFVLLFVISRRAGAQTASSALPNPEPKS